MAKVIDGVEVSIQMWANVTLSAEEIQDIYPAFEDMTADDDTDELETAIEEHMNMNYMEHVQYADGAMDECTVNFVYEDDGSE